MSTEPATEPIDVFERERPRLTGLAYRMLGTVSEAEDVVQDAWLRWRSVEPGQVARPEAWLTTVTTRIALDHIRSARRRRETYVGSWLPEPLVSVDMLPDDAAVLADSLRLGFLTLLDQLKPVDRAVFLLADVFCVPFADIADTVGKSEAACRQIASRARRRVRRPSVDRDPGSEQMIVDALMTAVATGDVDAVVATLAPDVVCIADGGAARRAARRPVVGPQRVARLLVNLASRYAGQLSVDPATVNTEVGAVITIAGVVDLVTVFEVHGDRIAAIRMVRNPDKLVRVGSPVPLR